MTMLVLHHYAISPFAEKARLMLGFKRLHWRSVTVPEVLPKPDVIALTGGYRRTPLLQIGADIYCDTALIAQVLDRLQPEPTFFPKSAPLAPLFAQWADSTFFWTAVHYNQQPAAAAVVFAGRPPEEIKAFGADRAAFSNAVMRRMVADAVVEIGHQLAALEAQLADGRQFLFGAPSIADFAAAHPVWQLRAVPALAVVVDPFPNVLAWHRRVLAFGHGTHGETTSAEALALAKSRAPAPTEVQPGLRYEAGQVVTVTPTDWGRDPVTGTLVGLSTEEVVIRREDERAGVVHVHFPRVGFQIRAEKK